MPYVSPLISAEEVVPSETEVVVPSEVRTVYPEMLLVSDGGIQETVAVCEPEEMLAVTEEGNGTAVVV